MEDTWLNNIICEKNLCIIAGHKLNITQQWDVAAKKANAISGCINRSIVSKCHEILVSLCLALSESNASYS